MPIKFKREGNACEKCKKTYSEVGKITHYKDQHDGYEGLLCENCIKKREKPYKEICPICKRLAYKQGGLTFFDDSDLENSSRFEIKDESDSVDYFGLSEEKPPSFSQIMCLECHEKKVTKEKKKQRIKQEIKNFAKNHWKFWISLTVSIIAVIIGLSRL